MKAMVLKKPGELVLEKREKPVCGERDVLIQVKACGIGEIDSEFVQNGDQNLDYPRVLGHEIAGVIAAKGKKINVYKVGQKVFVHPGLGCGKCQYCKKGLEHLCDYKEKVGFNRDGGFQEYLVFSEDEICRRMVNVVNHTALHYDEISLIPPLAYCVNIQDLLKIRKNESLLIIGGGRLGFLNYILAQSFGVMKIYLIEENKEQLELAKKLGFTGVFGDVSQVLDDLKDQEGENGVDVVITCRRKPEYINEALKIVKTKGRLGCIDVIPEKDSGSYDFIPLYQKEIEIYNVIGYGQSHTRKAQSLLEAEKVSVAELITHKVNLEDLIEGLDNIQSANGIATIVQL